ncbi:AraC family transcriptional regulator [Nocardia mexicana]|uniref:AraC-like DNA-binding protein n=1 Tax=Nocardia mexicana TaxID=279262 RepID=A0A370HEH0_9NOCA|nr:AraC family transcriptional regulator [Nocardia mexicana]RDI55435.1 AraC-like DNA-binding protein [Nocardia mexicana]
MADDSERVRSITSVELLAEFAAGRGLTPDSLLRGTGIDVADLADPANEITVAQEIAVTCNLVSFIGGEPGLGLLSGMLCHPSSLGVWGFALSTCPTLGHALEIGVRYVDLSFTLAHCYLETESTQTRLVHDSRGLPPTIRQFTVERDFAAIGTIQQDLLPMRLPALRLELELPEHPAYEAFAAVLGVTDIAFGSPQSILTMQKTALELPLPQANASTTRHFEQQCADLIQQRRARHGLSGQVRELLIRHAGAVDQADIAADLAISVRTLRRRLAEEGTSFRKLRCETTGLLAEELLAAGLTVDSVAERLGYCSVSAFTAAFRTWKGQSPGHFARRHRER